VLRLPAPLPLREAVERITDAQGAPAARYIERRFANQDFDFFYRIRHQGLQIGVRSSSWQPETLVQLLCVDDLPAEDPRCLTLGATLGWAPHRR